VAEALILDSEALNALAHATSRGVLAERARAILQIALERRAIVRVPAPVLAEVCRGPRFDAAVEHVLTAKGIVVADLVRKTAQRAGHLLAKAKLSSAHAVDAFVVATALEFDRAVIATGDVLDMQRLIGSNKGVRIFDLNASPKGGGLTSR
jgi:predicted nucleic acid-binding protein